MRRVRAYLADINGFNEVINGNERRTAVPPAALQRMGASRSHYMAQTLRLTVSMLRPLLSLSLRWCFAVYLMPVSESGTIEAGVLYAYCYLGRLNEPLTSSRPARHRCRSRRSSPASACLS